MTRSVPKWLKPLNCVALAEHTTSQVQFVHKPEELKKQHPSTVHQSVSLYFVTIRGPFPPRLHQPNKWKTRLCNMCDLKIIVIN